MLRVLFTAVLTIISAAAASGQCTPSINVRFGGIVPAIGYINSTKVVIARGRSVELLSISGLGGLSLAGGSLDAPSPVTQLFATASRAYGIMESGDLLILDVTGTTPVLMATFDAGPDIRGLAIQTNTVYLTTSSGLIAVDFTVPSSPLFVGQIAALPGSSYGPLVRNGNTLYISSAVPVGPTTRIGLEAVSIATPSVPARLGSFASTLQPSIASPSSLRDVAYASNIVYIIDPYKLVAVNVTTPAAMTQAGSIDTPTGGREQIEISGTTAYIARSSAGVEALNISNPNSISTIGSLDTEGLATGLASGNGRLFVGDQYGGAYCLDAPPGAVPTILGRYLPAPGNARAISPAGSLFLFADGSTTRVMNLANLSAPVHQSTLTNLTGYLASTGTAAYILGFTTQLDTWNITNSASPVHTNAAVVTGGFSASTDLALSGSALYVCNGGDIFIYDVSSQFGPVQRSAYTFAQTARRVFAAPGRAYVAAAANGLWILNTTNLNAAQLIGFAPSQVGVQYTRVLVDGQTAYVATGSGRLEVYDLSNIASPEQVGILPPGTGGDAGMVRSLDFLLTISGSEVVVIDNSVPTLPAIVDRIPFGTVIAEDGLTVVGTRITGQKVVVSLGELGVASAPITASWKPAFRVPPAATGVCPGESLTMSVNISAVPAVSAIQWFRNGQPLANGPTGNGSTYAGVNTVTLTLTDFTGFDAGLFSCSATNSCGTTLSPAVPVTRTCCPDYNDDGNVDQDDISYLINAIGGGPNPTGRDLDFNQDGNTDQDDILALINVVGGGPCP